MRRVSELMKWVRSGEYDRVMNGEYVRRGDPVKTSDQINDATDHYAERFKAFFKDAGESVDKATEKVGEAADKITDWLRERR